MAISMQIPFIKDNSSVKQMEKAASKTAQELVAPYFWGTIWIPGASYLWTIGWIVEGMIISRLQSKVKAVLRRAPAPLPIDIDQIDFSKVDAFSLGTKVTMVALNFLWFILIALFISIISYIICHGDGSTLGSAAAWVARLAVKIGTLNSANFEFCKQIPS